MSALINAGVRALCNSEHDEACCYPACRCPASLTAEYRFHAREVIEGIGAEELLDALRNLAFHAAGELSEMQREMIRMSVARAETVIAKAEGRAYRQSRRARIMNRIDPDLVKFATEQALMKLPRNLSRTEFFSEVGDFAASLQDHASDWLGKNWPEENAGIPAQAAAE